MALVRMSRKRRWILGGGDIGPVPISGLLSWYDFADASTLYQDTARTSPITADGQTIKGVTDKGSAAKHLSVALTDGPLYKAAILGGKSIGRFSAARADMLQATSNHNAVQPNTIFLVAQIPAAATQMNIVTSPSGPQNALYLFGDPSIGAMFSGGTVNSSVTVDDNVARIWCGVFNTPSSKLYLGGGAAAATGDPGSNEISQLALGASSSGSDQKVTGDVGEVLIYDTLLTLAQINTVGAYLNSKWGVTWTTAT